jgi:uncharacterized protein YraI
MFKKVRIIMVIGAIAIGLMANTIMALAAEFTVTADNARIRSEPSTSGDVIGSTTRGRKLAVSAQATDSQGATWYRVPVEGNQFGYIRSDMGTISGTVPGGNGGTNAAEGEVTPRPEQLATINQGSVRVRSGPSTSHNASASLPRGVTITINGEANDSSGRTWFQMTATHEGQEITGFVRSDMVTLGDVLEQTDPIEDPNEGIDVEPSEIGGNEPPETGNTIENEMDYIVTYEQNDIGGFDYYIYDLTDPQESKRWKVAVFLKMGETFAENEAWYQSQSKRERTIIIVLAVIVIILALVVAALLFKIREMYENAEDMMIPSGPRPDGPSRDKGLGQKSSSPPPSRVKGPSSPSRRPNRNINERPVGQRPTKRAEALDETARPRRENGEGESKVGENNESPISRRPSSERPNRRSAQADEKAVEERKKAQNFADDDEFEFEFLKIDD